MMESRPFVRIIDEKYGIFAFKLISISSKYLNSSAQELFFSHLQKITRLIKMLHDPSEDISYTIRTIILPHNEVSAFGKVVICLLVKFSINEDFKSLVDRADKIHKTIRLLLMGIFKSFSWETVTEADDLSLLLDPIDWSLAQHAEIRLQEEVIDLETTKVFRPIGFISDQFDEMNINKSNVVTFFQPLLTPILGFENLLETLLINQDKIILTGTIKPSELSSEEKNFLREQILISESYELSSAFSVRMKPNIQNHMTNVLQRQYLLLKDASFYLTFCVSSEKPLESKILEFIGTAISESIASKFNNALYNNYYNELLGGYEIVTPKTNRERAIVSNNMSTISQDLWGIDGVFTQKQRLQHLVDPTQAACVFYFPLVLDKEIPGIDSCHLKELPIPNAMLKMRQEKDPVIQLGTNRYLNIEHEVVLSEEARLQHTYIVGQTGTGKTTLIKTMILSDINLGNGIVVIDPHGEMYSELLAMIPEHRKEDVVLIDPSDREYPIGINLLQVRDDDERDYIIKEMRSIMKRYIAEYFNIHSGEFAGPVFFQHVQNNMLLATSDINNPSTMVEFVNIFQSNGFWRRWLPVNCKNPLLKNWITEVLPNTRYSAMSREGTRTGDYFSSKFVDFINDSRLAVIFGQPYSSLDFDEIISQKKIVLINLAKGLLGEANSSMLGMLIMAKLTSAFMRRIKYLGDEKKLSPFYLYVDEFQNIATENFSILLAEARKFGLGLIIANQYIRQVTDYNIRDAILGNVGTIVSFRLGIDDSKLIESQFLPEIGFVDLCNLPNYSAVVRTSSMGVREAACSFRTIVPNIPIDAIKKEDVINKSRLNYGTPRMVAEIILDSTLSSRRVCVDNFYWEKDGLPLAQHIRNINPITLFGITHFSQEDQSQVLIYHENVLIQHLVFYLIYREKVPKHLVDVVLKEIDESKQLIIEDIKSAIMNHFTTHFRIISESLFGLYNYLIKENFKSNVSVLEKYNGNEIGDDIVSLKNAIENEYWLGSSLFLGNLLAQTCANVEQYFDMLLKI
jgi:hypothetical protein